MWTSLVVKGFFRPGGCVEKAVKKVHKPRQRFWGKSKVVESAGRLPFRVDAGLASKGGFASF
jgi:hypothetical protein